MENSKFEIIYSSDFQRIWINDESGHCVARYSKLFGMDIHNSLEEQQKTGQQCLFCTHVKPSKKEYDFFRNYIKKLHNIDLIDIYSSEIFNHNNNLISYV